MAVIVQAEVQTYYALVFGLTTFFILAMVRRYDFGAWGVAAIVSIALFAAIALVVIQPRGRTLDVALAFTSQASRSQVMVAQRILAETSWLGTGAGTFAAMVPIYQNIVEPTNGYVAPTTVAAIMIEMGTPFFWAIALAAIAILWVLFRGSLRRQRDWYYPAAGASVIVTIALLSFANSALLSTPIQIIVAAATGMAVAQSRSRSI